MAEGKKITTEYFTDLTPCSVTSHKQAGPFLLGRLLGKGATGSVRIGTHVENGFQAAIKIVKKKYLEDAQNWRLFRREVAIMKMIDHPNIVKLYDVLESDKEIFLITELVSGGELFDYIPRGGLPHDEALRILSQIIRALSHCHKFGIVHRDLKPENIILDEHKNVKLGDFGMARLMKKGVLLKTSCGSPHYASPEVLKGGEYDGKVSDVWSLGVMLYAMCTFSLPFDAEHIRTLFKKIQKGVYRAPTNVRPEMADLISQMLTVDTKKRIKMDEIQYHPVFAKTDYFTLPLVRSAPSCTSLCFKNLNHHHHDSIHLDELELDEAALEDLNQLSLGWKSKEELARAILQEGSKEKFMYNLMMCTKRRRLEELAKKSPSNSRRNSLSDSSSEKYPASPFVDHNSPSTKTRTLATGSPSSRTRTVQTGSVTSASTASPSSKSRSIATSGATSSPSSKTRSIATSSATSSPASKTRTLGTGSSSATSSPASKVRTLGTGTSTPTGSPTAKLRTLVIEKQAGLTQDLKSDGKDTDSPKPEPEVELTEELLMKVVQNRGEEKFQHIDLKEEIDDSTRQENLDEGIAETTDTATTGEESEEEEESATSESPELYDAPPHAPGKEDPKDKDTDFDSLTSKLDHQQQKKEKQKAAKESTTATKDLLTTTGTTGPTTTASHPADISNSKSFRQSKRLFPAYHYQPTKDEVSQQQALIKSHSSHEKGFSANVNAIWSYLSSAFKRRSTKAKAKKRSIK